MPSLFGVEVSDHTYELNKHMLEQAKEPKTQARKDLDAEMRNRFAATFEATWRLLDGPELEKEFYFNPDRQWRADYMFKVSDRLGVERKYIVELDGGIWTGGRHVRGKGYIEDCMKKNKAALSGYYVICIPTGCATENYLSAIIAGLSHGEQVTNRDR